MPQILNPNTPATLVPMPGVPVAKSGQVTLTAPATLGAERTPATAQATIGGTATATNTVSLVVSHPILTSPVSVTYTVATGDTPASIAEGLAALLAANATLAAHDVTAAAQEAVVTVSWPGPVGNSATLSASTSSGATETVTLTPTSGAFAGGGGPIIPARNFTFAIGGQALMFWFDQPAFVGREALAALIAQRQPIL